MKIHDLLMDARTAAGRRNQAKLNRANRGFTTDPANTTPPSTTTPTVTTPTPSVTVTNPELGKSPQTVTPSGPTGDPTLDQPLPPTVRDPNKPGIGTRIAKGIGQLSKAVGAIGSVPQGVGRAVKKGYQAGVNAIGGPGAGSTAPVARASTAAPSASAGDDELANLKSMLQTMDQRLRRAGI